MQDKTCTKCGQSKPVDFFYRRSDHPNKTMSHCKECIKARTKPHRRGRTLKRFNLTVVQYEEMFSQQNGVCAICELPESTRALAVDHDHRCCAGDFSCGNCVRALLCSRCNVMIGMSRDSTTTLTAAINYLERW